MKNALLFTLLLICIGGCQLIGVEKGNGQIDSHKRLVAFYNEVRLTGNFEIHLKPGPKSQVVIVTDDNLLHYIQTEVDNGLLEVTTDKKLQSDHGIKIFLTYEELNKITSIGASIIKTEGQIVSERFELEVPGASLVDLDLDVTDLEVMLAGAGSVKLKGKANNQELSLNGVGHIEAFDLESERCKVTVSGMGEAKVNVKEKLSARVNGVGNISYSGNPEKVDEKVSGLGTIRPRDEAMSEEPSEKI